MISYEEAIIAFSQHGDKLPREAIVKILEGGISGLETVIRVLDEQKRPSVRRWAIECIGAYAGAESVNILKIASNSKYMTERLHTIITIRNNIRLDALDILEKLAISDPSGGVRLNAFSALLVLDLPRGQLIAEHLANDEKAYIRKSASKAILEFNKISAASPDRLSIDSNR